MLETIHEFAAEKLRKRPDHEALRSRHAAYFAEAMPDPLTLKFVETGRVTTAFLRLEADTENIRSALGWAAETGSELELRLATLYQLSPRVGLAEGRKVLADALARSSPPGDVRARALVAAGGLARIQGDFEEAQTLLEEGLALCRAAGDTVGVIEATRRLAFAFVDAGQLDRALRLVEEAESAALETGTHDSSPRHGRGRRPSRSSVEISTGHASRRSAPWRCGSASATKKALRSVGPGSR